jgi:hypothetical protein
MSIARIILCVVVAYIVYSIMYIGTMVIALGDLFAANAEFMRDPADPLMPMTYVAHLVQTIVVVLLFNLFVASNDVKRGAVFGLLVGAYLAATDSTFYFGLKLSTEPWLASMIIHLFVGALVGGILAKLYKEADNMTELSGS